MVDAAKITFLEESHELLQDMEDALLQLENSPQDEDLVNALFRAAHTIKGTAGIFGFDDVEAFTHIVENVLENLRSGRLDIDADLIAILLKCRDHIGGLVEKAVSDIPVSAEQSRLSAEYIEVLKTFLDSESLQKTEKKVAVSVAKPAAVSASSDPVAWYIQVEFGPEVLRNGMDPLSFIRYMERLGEITEFSIQTDRIPDLDRLEPELCYITLNITLKSADASKEKIESVFQFVQEDCVVSIYPPAEQLWTFISAIENLPDEVQVLGEILQHSGVLSQDALGKALEAQTTLREADPNGETPMLGELLVDKGMVAPEVVDAALGKQQKARENKTVMQKQLRVDADKLDALINLVGELVIAGAATNLLAVKMQDAGLLESISSMSNLVEDIRDSALRLRMVQIGETFNRFQRVVRDVSREINKDILLEINGGETELDKTMVEKIGDPLMHLVRNAMDHGIESAAERRQKGKAEQGKLQLNAYHDSGSIIIEVRDDGRGLDAKKILQKAISKGIVDDSANLSTQDIYRLIFEPGFSTAEQVTNLSGRGVGMDVVKKNIDALRGTVEVSSTPGEGSVITIRLPLTLAIIDGFLVQVSDSSYVIPLDMVVECIELSDADQNLSIHNNYMNLRGRVLPFLRLSDIFGEEPTGNARENIIVVQSGGQTAGLVVDALLGEFQTVIKPLGKLFRNLKGISGSTILGSGEVAMILDVPGLIQRAVAYVAANGHVPGDRSGDNQSRQVLH